MLRHFYIIICICESFTYDLTEKNLPEGLKVHNNGKNNDESKVVQLDMESFMSSDDDPQDYEPFDFNSKLNQRTQNEEYYESPINKFKREENAHYLNLKEGNVETVGNVNDDGTLNVQTSNEAEKENKISAAEERDAADIPVESHDVQDPEKKCIFRKMKIPFFSHKTTKQHKRRKLECMNCGNIYTNDPELQANEEVNQIVRRLKRAYGNVCPNCIRNLIARFHKKQSTPKKQPSNPVKLDQKHNSKEFYQIMATTVSKENEVQRKGSDDNFEYFSDHRTKRDEVKDRQMKELADVEMKVQNVKVTTPKISGRMIAVTKF